MSSPEIYHSYLPDGRSLCDRAVDLDVKVAVSAPLCGSCVVLLHGMRSSMMIQAQTTTSVVPSDGPASVLALKETRWAVSHRLDELAQMFAGATSEDLLGLLAHGYSKTELDRAVQEQSA